MSQLFNKFRFIAILMLLLPILVAAQADIPTPMEPKRLVNDFANLLDQNQLQELENKLTAFNDSTGVQIAVVIVSTLKGYDPSDFAQRIGQNWGVGGGKFDNGFVLLVKPKSPDEKGEAFIATGYGVEKFVPDATAYDIVNNEMIPFFKQNDYPGGINAGTEAIFKFVSGEYKPDKYKSKSTGGKSTTIIIIIIIIIVIVVSNNNNNHHTISRGGGGTGPIFFPWSGGGSSGGFGGFGGGGSSGGFGGFGGGGFGGGGAGGSW